VSNGTTSRLANRSRTPLSFVESCNAFNGRLRDELLNTTLSTRSPMPERC
jgi:hypothetical protein